MGAGCGSGIRMAMGTSSGLGIVMLRGKVFG